MQLPPQQGGGLPGMPRPPFPGPPSQSGARPPFPVGPGGPPGPGMPLPGAPRPPTDQFQSMNLGGQQGGMPGPGAPSGMPPPFRPPGMGGPMPGMGGPMPPPSNGLPIMLPNVAPPSVNTGALAGIPPPSQPGMNRGMPPPPLGMMPNGPSQNGPPSGGMPPPPGMSMGMPPSMGMGGPPPPMGMSMGGPPPPMGMGGPMPPPPMQQGPPPPMGMMQQGLAPPPFSGGMGPPGPPGPGMGPPQRISTTGTLQMQQQMQQQQPQNRIDPSQIPRPVAQPPSAPQVYETRVAGQNALPPAASSRFIVRDRGSAGPRFMRSTLNHVPFSNDLLNNSAMPLSLVVSPLALPDPADDQIAVVDMGELGPVRCSRCKAYMNAFVRFSSSGRNYTCNFCNHNNTVPDAYFCHMGHDGRRRDADERAELCRGSVEYVATQDYMIRPPMAQAHFFLIDVTHNAVVTGATASACSCISRILDDIPCPERTKIGIATFDSTIQYFSLRPGAAQPFMLTVPDVNEVYVPDSAPLLMDLTEIKDDLVTLLELIPNMFAATTSSASCAGAAIEASIAVLQHNGGKVHAFVSQLPTAGIHALKMRDANGVSDKDKMAYLTSQDNTLKSLASMAADFQVCIDISFMAQGYCDLASLQDLTSTTGGTLYQYTPFNPLTDHDQVLNDLKWNIVRPQGLEAVMRVRASQGLEVESYLGAFYRQPANPTDVFLPAIDCDKSILATLRHVEKLSPGAEAYLQAALLYTTTDGQRRIRVHTLALTLTDNMSNIFKGADLDAQIATITRRLAATMPGSTLVAGRESVTNATVGILAAYRKYCAAASSAVQLILPEALKLLPLYTLSLLKGPALKDGVKPDERSLWLSQMMSLPAGRITPLLYPRLLPLRQQLESGEAPEELPDGLVLSSEVLEMGGIFLLENGFEALLYVDKAVNPQLLQDILGVPSYDELCRIPTAVALLPRDNPAAQCLQQLLVKVRVHRSSYLRLRVTRKGDPHETQFFNLLVEDRSTAGMSYVEYLCQVHRLIQTKLM